MGMWAVTVFLEVFLRRCRIRDWVEKGKSVLVNIFLLFFGKRNRDEVLMLFNTVHLTQLNEEGKFPRATG